MLSSYHKIAANPPQFSGNQASYGNAAATQGLQRRSWPPDVSRIDVVMISVRRLPVNDLPKAHVRPNGLVVFDEAVIQQGVAQGPALLPVLDRALRNHAAVLLGPNTTHEDLLRTLHTLHTAERLADSGVSIDSLYPALSTLDSIPNPLLTIYLAGAYSKLTRPEPLGWALMTMARLGAQQAMGGQVTPHLLKAHEEVGKVVSYQLQRFPALLPQLLWWQQTFAVQK
ncbi:MAG: hypothetical protein QE263_06600 [Vampirovibrionales bacterium]|nr:hypothetical protein [Vampirovibrionales bacterium]